MLQVEARRIHDKLGAPTRSKGRKERTVRERERKAGERERGYRSFCLLAMKLGVVVGEWSPRGENIMPPYTVVPDGDCFAKTLKHTNQRWFARRASHFIIKLQYKLNFTLTMAA